MSKTACMLAALILVFPNCLYSQEFFGTATISKLDNETSLFSGQLTVASDTDQLVTLEFENVFGETYTQDVVLFSDGEFLAVVSNDGTPKSDLASARIIGGNANSSSGVGIVLVDTDDLGEDWDPHGVDPMIQRHCRATVVKLLSKYKIFSVAMRRSKQS